ncbi:spore protease YyaC [Peribacillus cavernae]|uniref:Spore protease YyaC n=1 Tax=Peribacillus cavernae TaxID=1674310 RepID=A0A3S0V787_9BACI|nr:spore protease YyaC [Peribacillus cavernae]MDQ0220948.1 putative sporulation protein YyaC [Peribacillus cavernae]RUQ24525.1 spore protease YyaC [Peribacillus cavernae]
MNLKSSFFENKNTMSRILHEDLDAVRKISQELLTLLPEDRTLPIVIVCIGTDRSTGDSLGPLVGTFLEEKAASPFFVYGTLDDPIHAMNLKEKLAEIKTKHVDPFIIGVDACLGRIKSVGIVQIGEGPVKPGAGVNKDLPAVGEAHITGIVNVSGFMEFMVLQNTRLNLVLKMARTIANGIYFAGSQHHGKNNISHLNWAFDREKTP